MTKEVQLIQSKHIQPGIEKYQGKLDNHLQAIIDKHGYEYKVYIFNDGRVLLVLPQDISALLYASREVLYEKLELV